MTRQMTRQQTRAALIAAVLVVAALATGLVLTALGNSVAYFYTPSQLVALAAPPKSIIRLGGLVAAGSVAFRSGERSIVDFVVEDGRAATKVSFEGVLPDLFREGQGVVVQGRVAPDGRLSALEVLAKHDETYMPREVAEALKEQGVWREPSPKP